jgi:hypothetical protein
MVVLVMHGHLIRFIDRTDDYVFSRLVITPEIFDEMLSLTFSHDVNKYHSHPEYILTDEQVQKLMKGHRIHRQTLPRGINSAGDFFKPSSSLLQARYEQT